MKMIALDGKNYAVVECGGEGDCLFKSLAYKLNKSSHENVRCEIVNFVTDNWNSDCSNESNIKYKELVENVFDIRNRRHYSDYMSRGGNFASEVECIAASYKYNVNIVLVKIALCGEQFVIPLRTDSSGQTIYLLFSGETDNGHFRALELQENEGATEDANNFLNQEMNCSESSDHNPFIHCESVYFASNESYNCEMSDRTTSSNSFKAVLDSPAFIDCFNTSATKRRRRNTLSESSSSSAECETRSNFSKATKEIIISARDYFQAEKDAGVSEDINKVVERTARCLNIGVRSVCRVAAEYVRNGGEVQCPQNCRAGRKPIEFDEHIQGVVRRTIFNMYLSKEYPTVTKILRNVQENVDDFPEISDFTLRKLLKNMNFTFKKLQNRSVLMEKSSIAGKRAEFLRMIHHYRRNGYCIYYTDETWCGANHHLKYGWLEKVDEKHKDNFDVYRSGIQEVDGYRGGFVVPSGSGKRVIILHIGSKDGFVDGSLKCFIGKKGSADYHDEMNAAHFEEWFRDVLCKLPPKSIIVIDQAPYHTMLDPERRNPTSNWRKENIIQWMTQRNIPLPTGADSLQDLSRVNLLQLCVPYKFEKSYLLDKIAKEIRGDEVKLLWLPVAHCEFNAIEYVWAYVKKKVAAQNITFKINDVQRLCETVMNSVPPTLWENCVRHVEEVERKYRVTDDLLEREMEPLIININGEDSSDEEIQEYATQFQ